MNSILAKMRIALCLTLFYCGCGTGKHMSSEMTVVFINDHQFVAEGNVYSLNSSEEVYNLVWKRAESLKVIFTNIENCRLIDLFKCFVDPPPFDTPVKLISAPLFELLCSNGQRVELRFQPFDSDMDTREEDPNLCLHVDLRTENGWMNNLSGKKYKFVEIKCVLEDTYGSDIENVILSVSANTVAHPVIYISLY